MRAIRGSMWTPERLLKIRKMSLGEACARGHDALRQRWERRLWQRTGRRIAASGEATVGDRENLLDAVGHLVRGMTVVELERLCSDHSQRRGVGPVVAAGRAESVLSGQWIALGYDIDLHERVDWQRDPRRGYFYPRSFYADLSLQRLPEGVDIKYVWELGRQAYLVDLARGWLFTGEERFAQRARQLLVSWIRENPLYEGIHWTSALEVAVRAVSWIWTLAGLANWHGWEPGDVAQVARSLADHATYLEHHFSFYSSPYNHLVGEATGLYLIGLALRQLDESHRWRRRGRQVLLQHGPKQFHRDGFCVEQAVGYHYYTLGFLSLAIAAARTDGAPLAELEPLIHGAYRAGAAFRQPDGRWPAIGDVDSARSIPVHHDDFWDFNSLCSLGAVLFDDPELAFSEEAGPEVYWLLGCEGVARFERLRRHAGAGTVVPVVRGAPAAVSGAAAPAPAAPSAVRGSPAPAPTVTVGSEGSGRPAVGGFGEVGRPAPSATDERALRTDAQLTVLEDAGYVIARDGRDWLLFDAGPIAAGLFPDATPSAAHGHADMLQVLYWMNGKPVLIDCGMPFYNGPRDWVDHFRAPAAHNTIAIDGAAMVHPAGPLAWSHVAPRPELAVEEDVRNLLPERPAGGCAQKTPDTVFGFGARVRWAPGVTVERHLLCLPGHGLWIADWIETDRPRQVRWYWQLPARTLHGAAADDSRPVVARGENLIFASWSTDSPFAARLDTPSDDCPVAWDAFGYGQRRPAQRLERTAMAETRLLTVHFVGAQPQSVEFTLRRERLCCDWNDAASDEAETGDENSRLLTVGDAVWTVGGRRSEVTQRRSRSCHKKHKEPQERNR